MPKVFEGFTVVEIADRRNQMIGKVMSDCGARVIQIEPVAGSPGRWIGPFVNDQEDPDKCLDYWWYNTGKESICIDITRKPGQDLIRRLVAKADVFVESTKPRTMEQYGLDHAALSSTNQGLIYASLTDFGQDGPWVDWVINDPGHLALGGQMGLSGYTNPRKPPIGGQGHQAYNMASIMMLHTITVSLYQRMTSAVGQYLDVSIHDCCAVCTGHDVPGWLWYNEAVIRQTGQHASHGPRPRQPLPTADGRDLHVIGPVNGHVWVNLVKWMNEFGVAEELADERWLDDYYRADQLRNSTAVEEGLIRLFSHVPSREAFIRAQAIGLAWAVVQAPEENLEYDHYRQRNFWASVEQPEIGTDVLYPSRLIRCDEIGMQPAGRAPHLGEHTRTILTGDLDLDVAQVDVLTRTGVIR